MTLGRTYPIIRNPKLVADDLLLRFGTDSDIVALNRSTVLAADAEVTNVIEGTSDHWGVAANSLIISNITDDGDILLLVSKAGNSQGMILLDGSTGDLELGAASGQSVDTFIAGVKEIDYATGALAFQQATIISTTAGGITLDPTTTLIITPTANTEAAVTATGYYTIDTRTGVSAIFAHSFNASAPTIASGATARWGLFDWGPPQLNYTGATQVTSLERLIAIRELVIASDTVTLTVDKATTFEIVPPGEGTNVSLTESSAIRILNGVTGTPTTLSGIIIEGLTTGSTNNLQLVMLVGGTEPVNTVADRVGLYAVDIAATRTTLGIRCEEAVIGTAELASTHKLVVRINGVSYGIMLTTTLT